MSYSEYAALPGLRASEIKAGRTSMAHMRAAVNGEVPKKSEALRWGNLFHLAVLEPKVFAARMSVWDGGRKYGKEWDKFRAEAKDGDIIVTPDELAELNRMSVNAHADREAHRLIEGTEHEMVLRWELPNVGLCKAKVDGFGAVGICELKSTTAVSEHKWKSQVESLGYLLQLAWYRSGLRANGHQVNQVHIVAVESNPPHTVQVWQFADHLLDEAMEEATERARRYRVCERCGAYPGPVEGVQVYERPAWAGGAETAVDDSGLDQVHP
jgi:hypothetical protein